MIRAEDLTKRYADGTLALQGVTVVIRPGEMVGLLGPSGAGKTTFLRLLYGALQPTAGRLEVLGNPMGQLSPAALRRLRRRVAVISQSHHVIPNLSVLHNVLIGRLGHLSTGRSLLALARTPPEEVQRAYRALAWVGLAEELFTRAEALSGGQQQRVAVARALVQGASLILADEPVASVDVRTAETVLEVLRELHQQGKTVVLSLHQVDFALAYCTRLLGLNGGRLVYDGPPKEIEGLEIYRTEEEVRDDHGRAPAFERTVFEPRV